MGYGLPVNATDAPIRYRRPAGQNRWQFGTDHAGIKQSRWWRLERQLGPGRGAASCTSAEKFLEKVWGNNTRRNITRQDRLSPWPQDWSRGKRTADDGPPEAGLAKPLKARGEDGLIYCVKRLRTGTLHTARFPPNGNYDENK